MDNGNLMYTRVYLCCCWILITIDNNIFFYSSLTFLCNFKMSFYPFDVQECSIKMRLNNSEKQNLRLKKEKKNNLQIFY